MEQDFKISCPTSAIIIEKDNQGFAIFQSTDDDIWFSTSHEEMSIDLNIYSRNFHERKTGEAFETLMKSLIGKYILNGDNDDEYSCLPKDFIDLKNKVITWHSDSGRDNILKLEYRNNRNIKISILKSKNEKDFYTNAVRIRTDGSEYGYYYQEFLEFFRQLSLLEKRLNKKNEKQEIEEPKKILKISNTRI